MKKRIILHCDLNNFFASVSLLFNKTLYDMPVAVCGREEDRHGIVLAKNEIAKKFGVKTAETVREAKKKCPNLVILPPDYEAYKKYSLMAREIYGRFTDMIEPFGIDECWLDVTGSEKLFGSGYEIAEKIRKAIKKELGITVSVGVSFNKIFAKLGSDMKKPDGVTVITEENFKDKIWKTDAADLLFIGKSTASRLKSIGVVTIGDLARCDENTLKNLLGKTGPILKSYACGEDNSPVKYISEKSVPKSIGRSVTLDHDIDSLDEVWKILLTLSGEIAFSLKKSGLFAGGVQIHIRDSNLNVKEISSKLESGSDNSLEIARFGFNIFKENYPHSFSLRSLGIRAFNLKNDNFAVQPSFFENTEEKALDEKIENSLDLLNEKFGKNTVKRASVIEKSGQNSCNSKDNSV